MARTFKEEFARRQATGAAGDGTDLVYDNL